MSDAERGAGFWNRRFESVAGFTGIVLLASLVIVGALLVGNDRSAAPAAAQSGLSGFGATDAAWNAHHREDTRFAPGAAYDPDPSLARGGDHRYDDRYYAVGHAGGRVMNYEMRFQPGTGIQEAKRSVLVSEFPSDAKIAWLKRLDSCAQMLVRSKKVARELGGQVAALVEFSSGKWGDEYDPGDVWSAIVLATESGGPGSGFGC